jgi:hypothetical protein
LGAHVFSSSSQLCNSQVVRVAGAAVSGVVCLKLGLQFLHQDRRRGKMWMETGEEADSIVVYSYGGLLVPLGLLCLAYVISLPIG